MKHRSLGVGVGVEGSPVSSGLGIISKVAPLSPLSGGDRENECQGSEGTKMILQNRKKEGRLMKGRGGGRKETIGTL